MPTLALKDFNGFKMPPQFGDFIEKIENLEVRNDDVWVTSFPKCGTTWTQEMVWLIGNNLDYEGAKTDLEYRFPFIEYNSFHEEYSNFNKKFNLNFKRNAVDTVDFFEMVEKNKNVRYIKSHLPWDFLPKQIKDGTKTPKIIHVMRNPKQVFSSYYNHAAKVFIQFVGTLEEFTDFFVKGHQLYGDYFRTVLSYWEQRHLPNLLILTYEEMHADLVSVIKKVSAFLGKSYTEEEMQKLAHHLNIDQMKKNLAVNGQMYIKDENLQFIRSGTVDSYRKEFSPEIIAKLDEWMSKNIIGTGLPYENQ